MKSLTRRRMPRVSTALSVLGAAALMTGCNLGDGTQPNAMTLLSATTLSTDEVVLFECFEGGVSALVTFNNGQAANFLAPNASRPVTLESSDESVVRVSNGDTPIPLRDGLVYPRGTLIPAGPGTATVTARFASLEDTITVRVQPTNGVEVSPGVQTVGVGSSQTFVARAVLEGGVVDTEVSALWSLVDGNGEPVDAALGTIDAGSGRVQAVSEGGPFTVRAQLSACPDEATLPPEVNPANLQATAIFKEPQAIELEREFQTFDDQGQPLPAPPLVAGNTEFFNAFFTFADPADGRQDISTQAQFLATEVDDMGEDQFSFAALFGAEQVANLVLGATPTEPGESLSVTASFGTGDDMLTSNVVPLQIVTAIPESIALTPEDATVARLGLIDYTVNADFRLTDDSLLTQTITRLADLTSSDTNVAFTSTSPRRPGRVLATGDDPGCSFIRAQVSFGTAEGEAVTLSDETRLFVIDDTVDCVPVDDNGADQP